MVNVNPVGWFEIYVKDMDRATQFYKKVFQVDINDMGDPTGQSEMRSFPMEMKGEGAAGALVKMDGYEPGYGGTIVYFAVEDCAVESSRVVDAGGKIVKEKESVGDYGWICLFEDTEGNLIGLHAEK